MNNKVLAERLNRELDAIGVPGLMMERVLVCSKLFKIPRFKIESLLNGVVTDYIHIQTIARELEVNLDWLLGDKNKTH